MPPYNNSHKMKQPTKKETKKEYDRLKKLTKSGRYTAFNPIKIIATETETEYKLSPNQIKNMLLGESPATWRPHHFTYWEACKSFVKIC